MIPTADMAQIENTTFSRKVGRMWGIDLHSWEQLMLWSLAAAALAALAVVVTTTVVVTLQKEESEASNERIAQLNNETARLRAQEALTIESLLANVHSMRSSAITGQATRTVAERIAVAQGLIDSRSMSEAARSLSIIPKVTPFAGKKFDAIVTSIDIELGTLLITLRTLLKNAGWIEIERSDPTAGVGIFSMNRAGGPALVSIEVDASRDPELLDAATELASALDEQGIAAAVSVKTDTTNAETIHILVGPKPL
jgi:hypothetical protein